MRTTLFLMMLALIAPRAAAASTYRWTADVSGNWNNPANWTLIEGPAGAGYPDSSDDTAHFSTPGAAEFTVTIPDGVSVTVETLILQNARITIAAAGSGQLVLDTADAEARITTPGVSSKIVIDVPIRLQANLLMDVPIPITFSNVISDDGTPWSVTIVGGRVLFDGPLSNTYTGPTIVRRGLVELGRTHGTIAIPGPLVIEPDLNTA